MLSDYAMWEAFGGRALGRIVYGGADIGECRAAAATVAAGDTDAWHSSWTAVADRLAAVGDGSAAKGRAVSAREAYVRAATYYQIAYLPLYGKPVDPRLVAAFDKEVAVFHKAAALFDPAVEVLEIPFEGTTLPAYFVKVDDSGQPRPTLVCTNGYDSNIQEMYFAHAVAATRRGYNCLLFDGPGQGGVLIKQGLTIRPNWETVVSPVIDFALTLPEIDPEKIVLNGWSFGGFLAPRAAAFEHRIAALIADPGQGDERDAILPRLPLTDEQKAAFPDIDPKLLDGMAQALEGPNADPMLRWAFLQRGFWVHGVDTLCDYMKDFVRFEVLAVAPQISCPTLLTEAEGDPVGKGGAALLAALTVRRKERMFFKAAEGAGGHCEAFARTLYHQRTFDWLDETLAMSG
ncbi:MAG: alpha/beta hydrolase [Rhodobacteraceae bacterium]|nr:alpha/beta hydrolase [Paracoccaceae bacterium]